MKNSIMFKFKIVGYKAHWKVAALTKDIINKSLYG